ncbi:DUF4307 domain-containing protein [Corynebacterium sp. Marseille-P4321]|uniref:DUF4307 domain-containing protein n=1 Tax=Corynebacterium sp. Marseille-P4321 TaxID=2736603 RepID=UPI0020CA4C8B|nr:DUF4307 domain-containing protein [Corynebacterium sp. Marseille-P4321]
MSTTSSRPASRYGSAKRATSGGTTGGKVIAVVTLVLLIAVLVVGGRAISQRMNRPITADFISAEHVDDSTGRLWIEVQRKDPSVPSYCIVTAVDYSHAEVGRREVVMPAGGEELVRIPVEMPLRAPLVSGHVYGCSTTMPSYLDPGSDFYQAR